MKFILDFDRVLFDTDAFSAWLRQEGLADEDRDLDLIDTINERGLDWSQFVNQDVVEFLEQHGSDCYIVSSYISSYRGDNQSDSMGMAEFQREKIIRSGIHKLVKDQVFVVDENKKKTFAELKQSLKEELVFIDDSPRQVETARELNYDHVVWMATAKELFSNPKPEQAPSYIAENVEGVERVTSFSAFVELVKAWKRKKNQ